MYADYTFYATEFFGNAIDEADFPRLSSRASDFLDYYTRGKAASSEYVTELAKACCAVAEAMQETERVNALAANAMQNALANRELKSESVGSYSVTYATASDYARANEAATRQAYANVAMQYLANTGLLYRGGC